MRLWYLYTNQIKFFCKVQFPNNLILNDEIEKKIELLEGKIKKRQKKWTSQPRSTCQPCDQGHEIKATL
jgi:hypothetical protein